MSHYGVRKLVVINSGGFEYACLDLGTPVQLVAPNNRGKSTLVNALQFLYVDDINQMVFGKSVEDTRKHYFGRESSYLVFECATPSGIQCLVVRGLSNLRGGLFERYVYDHAYDLKDYTDGEGTIIGWDVVRTRLASRRLSQVHNKDLWEVLSGQIQVRNSESAMLGILPIRKLDEYRSFRDIFVRLLSLTNVDARTLRELVIACHAKDIQEEKIDIAADYRDEFGRAERSEQNLEFMRVVSPDVDRGRLLRTELQTLVESLTFAAPGVVTEAANLIQRLDSKRSRLVEQQTELRDRIRERDLVRGERQIELGGQRKELEISNNQMALLQQRQMRWSCCTPELVAEMRRNATILGEDIVRLRHNLDQAGRLDLAAVRREKQRLERQLADDRQMLDDYDRTAVAALLTKGISESELEAVFKLLNPGLLRLTVGVEVHVLEAEQLVPRLRALAARMDGARYHDEAVDANLSRVHGIDLKLIRDREHLRNEIALTGERLGTVTEELRIAESVAESQRMLHEKEQDHARRLSDLNDYDDYVQAWEKRGALEQRIEAGTASVARTVGKISALEQEIHSAQHSLESSRNDAGEAENLERQARDAIRALRQAMDQVGLDVPPAAGESQSVDHPEITLEAARGTVRTVERQCRTIADDARKVAERQQQLRNIQTAISRNSRAVGDGLISFSDEEEEWNGLIERRETMGDLEAVTKKLWDGLFTTLGGRLDGVRRGYQSVVNAVMRINNGLKSYQVSNLKSVQLKVEPEHDTYSMIEALTSQDSIFQDREQLDAAKRRLWTMIDQNRVIELQALFGLHIIVERKDGSRNEVKSLDDIGSTGTGMTAKAMIFIQLVRAVVRKEEYLLHFYLDETGQLDDSNLEATTAMAVSKGVMPITA